MRRFQQKKIISQKNIIEEATIGSPAMERGVTEQPADTPTKKPTKMKRARAFVRGCFKAVIGFFGACCKDNGQHRETDDFAGKYCDY